MFQLIGLLNLIRPWADGYAKGGEITMRGYSPEAFIPSEFVDMIKKDELKTMSVSNIAVDYQCPTGRDLYFLKGSARVSGVATSHVWEKITGNFVEEYVEHTFSSEEKLKRRYSSVIDLSRRLHGRFARSHNRKISEMRCNEHLLGDTTWVLSLLESGGRVELGDQILHSVLNEKGCVQPQHLRIRQAIRPHTNEIGITSPAEPDFIIPEFGLVGDIKTGVEFNPRYQLTCAGYALAYENEHQKGHEIDWGAIYFFPVRKPSYRSRPISFAQVYLFHIGQELRQWFVDERDKGYRIISSPTLPNIPSTTEERKRCPQCTFTEICK